MSLRTIFLDELNALAKAGSPAFPQKVREVVVDRHPATLDPDEQDPVSTVALAWKEVARRGRPAFEECALALVGHIEGARIEGDATRCDWPFAHAILRLLAMLPHNLVGTAEKARCTRMLAGLVAERQEFLDLATPAYPEAPGLWRDAFRLYLLWHKSEPSWLKTIWETTLIDDSLPIDEGASPILADAAARHPSFITFEVLIAFWRAAVNRRAPIEDIRRWFYIVGAVLEDTPEGRSKLTELHETFGGHLQDYRLEHRGVSWDHFVESASGMFRNQVVRRAILELKTQSNVSYQTHERQHLISDKFKSDPNTVQSDLINSLLMGVAGSPSA